MAKATHLRHRCSISSIKTVIGFLAAACILQIINLIHMISRSPLPAPLIGSMNMIKPQNLQMPPVQHRRIPFAYFFLLAGETHQQFTFESAYPLRSHLTLRWSNKKDAILISPRNT